MTTHPVPAVLAVVAREGRVLLVRRANPPDAGLWGFPGGKIEHGETLAAAALRELAEETGVTARAGGVLTALDALQGDGGYHFVLVALRCEWVAGAPVAGDDALEARWVSLEEMTVLELSAGVYALARQGLGAGCRCAASTA
ncbi:ADP-ribose pyrophosphatase YjhB (NUDIX family) [Rhodovulum imhoffii]|uniref:ADP-ribose pyrophosphatase YjhB (NUDIX family) n=1 Tax=Rhodovulum imhoffii TaxID=365340 RepID=A0A2T5BU78_9RHOB|nr:NUDIX hydrolase [Rhodovulum imhoffii]MBK5934564.1 ADP-ribose pyrophosphatase [Rhodovulum imhoffii]PTN03019.1 ADP-ribose pyrophosphatase YjhB (NUDIX family) [Rhodovulum imhoffii]